jgi:hypothetical protein
MSLRHPDTEAEIRHLNTSLLRAVQGMAPEDTISIGHAGEFAACTVAQATEGAQVNKDAIKSAFLRLLPSRIEDLAEVLVKRRWGIIFSDKADFVTSDSPVVLRRGKATKTNFGFATPGTEILFPISPARLLTISDEWPYEFAHYKLTKPDIYNRMIALHANRFVFSHRNDPALTGRLRNWRALTTP